MLSPTHMCCGLLCVHSLLQGTIKLTFADQHSQQTDHLDAYKPKPEIKVCIQFRAVKCGAVWCGGGVGCGVVRCGVVWCGVVWCSGVCGVVGVVWCGFVRCGECHVVQCGVVWCVV